MAVGRAAVDGLLRRDRWLVVAALIITVLLAWAYLIVAAGVAMPAGGGMSMDLITAPAGGWTPGYAALTVTMWAVMMAAMMLPSAAPMILLFSTVSRRTNAAVSPFRLTGAFALGYLGVWGAFALVAAAAQWVLEQAMLLTPTAAISSMTLASLLFVAAGAYQLLPLKQACLRRCRSPVEFLARYWRAGAGGAFRMGLRHGAFCVGCCWVLMTLLFVGGVMNALWIGALALIVLIEKLAAKGQFIGKAFGLGLIAWGAGILAVAWA